MNNTTCTPPEYIAWYASCIITETRDLTALKEAVQNNDTDLVTWIGMHQRRLCTHYEYKNNIKVRVPEETALIMAVIECMREHFAREE